MMKMSKNLVTEEVEEEEAEEVAEVVEVEETEVEEEDKTTLVDNREDKIQRNPSKKPKKTSQLCEREDHFDLLQKSWMIQLPM